MYSLVNKLAEKWALAIGLVISIALIFTHAESRRQIDPEDILDAVVIIGSKAGYSGTGFFFSDDGCVMTANHVISEFVLNGEPIYITTRGNGREYPAHLAASNEKMDIAILCSLAKPGRTARIINSEHIRPGDRVHAAGHPSGKMWQITEGTVSRMSHRMHYIPSEKIMVPRYNLFVSAFIHYGNSGGPLFDAYGNVIGMITEFEDYGLEMPGSIAVATPGTDMLRFIRTVWGKS